MFIKNSYLFGVIFFIFLMGMFSLQLRAEYQVASTIAQLTEAIKSNKIVVIQFYRGKNNPEALQEVSEKYPSLKFVRFNISQAGSNQSLKDLITKYKLTKKAITMIFNNRGQAVPRDTNPAQLIGISSAQELENFIKRYVTFKRAPVKKQAERTRTITRTRSIQETSPAPLIYTPQIQRRARRVAYTPYYWRPYPYWRYGANWRYYQYGPHWWW